MIERAHAMSRHAGDFEYRDHAISCIAAEYMKNRHQNASIEDFIER
jgi:hypothetical protein